MHSCCLVPYQGATVIATVVDKAVNAKVRALAVFQEASTEITMSAALPGARESVALFTSQATRSTIKGHGKQRGNAQNANDSCISTAVVMPRTSAERAAPQE